MELHDFDTAGAEFSGREREVRQLQGAFERSLGPEGVRVAITGPSGIGKTHLLRDWGRRCSFQGAAVVMAAASRESGGPYDIWRQVVRRLIEMGHDVTSDFPRIHSDVLLGLVAAGSSSALSSSVLPALPAEQVRYRLYDAVRMYLRKVSASHPVVILMDDVQWADEASGKLFRYLFDFACERRLMFVLAADAVESSVANREILSLLETTIGPADRIALQPLEKDWVVNQIDRNSGRIAGRVNGEALFCITKGHPLHTILALELLARSHQTEQSGSERNDPLTTALGSLGTPQSAASRLVSCLPAEAQRILTEAAVVAFRFTAHEISALIQRTLPSVQEALALSQTLGLLARDGGDVHQFRHSLIRDSLIDILDDGDRLPLLRHAAKTARQSYASDRIWQAAEWSYATRGLSSDDDGVAACLEAAAACKHRFAPELSTRYLRLAQELAPDDSRTTQEGILTDLALSAADAGDLAAASTAAERVLEILAQEGRPHSDVGGVLTRFAQVFHDAGADDTTWRPFKAKALERTIHLDERALARLELLEAGKMQRLSGAPIQAGRWIGLDRKAVKVARELGNEDDYCRTLLVYDWMTTGDVDRLLKRAATWERPHNRARALSVAAETFMYRHGQFERACGLLQDQLHMHEASGSLVEQAKSLVRLTMAQLAAGELQDALSTRKQAEDMVARLGQGYLIYEHAGTTRGGDLYPGISMESNFAWYLEGNWKAVAEHWVRAISLEEPGGSPVHIVEAAMAAQAFARLDSFDEARFYLRELTPILHKLQPRDWAFNGAVGRASHAIWDMRDADFAQDYRAFALSLLEAGVGDWTNTSLTLTVARSSALLGNQEESYAYFDKARTDLHPKIHDPRRAIIDYDHAVAHRLLRDANQGRAQALLEGAIATFRTRGMEGWAQRAAKEKSQIGQQLYEYDSDHGRAWLCDGQCRECAAVVVARGTDRSP